MINDESDMKVVGDASNINDLMSLLKKTTCDILVLDISMPGMTGYDALAKIKMLYPAIKVLMLSALSEETYALKTIKAGASGFLNKESTPEELTKAIRKIFDGNAYISEMFAEKLVLDYKHLSKGNIHDRLSEREFQILTLIGSGKKTGEIADLLSLSVKTVSTYRSRIFEKMEMKSNAEIIKYCISEELILV